MEKEIILKEVTYKAVRSSGAGGQNVNKVSSKVVLTLDVSASNGFSDEEKELLIKKLQSKLTQENILILNCDEDRSQFKNKEIVTKRLFTILQNALKVAKPRKATKTPRSVIEKRLKNKATKSITKQNRKKPDV
ncbi:MAG: ribosome-associated protein [Flavobacterium sp.]|jgi:ribosome-associated protein